MTVQEIMTKEPECCTTDTKLQEVSSMMARCDCGAIPVVEDMESKHPIGIVTDRDIVTRVLAKGENYQQLSASAAMTRSTVTVQPDSSLHDAEEAMKSNQIRRLVVVDEDGRCMGILSQADIARHRPEGETGDLVEEISEPSAVASDVHA